jgi:hypothetical protein
MNISKKRIPTIIGIVILILGIIGGVVLVQKGGVWFLKAEPEAVPQEIRVTNIADTSFTVSWITKEEVLGFVKYGPNLSLGNTVGDERDMFSDERYPYFVHHVKVENLAPKTKYYFKIGSGTRLYDNNGQLYEITTAPHLGTPPAADTVYGTILKTDGSAAEGVIVYLSLANSTPLSALTRSGGNWAIPLGVARTANLTAYVTYDLDASVEEVFVQGGNMGAATAIVTTRNDSPVPSITLGRSYDFREVASGDQTAVTPPPSGDRFSTGNLTPPPDGEKVLKIINPEEDEEVATQRPEVLGEGPVGRKLQISIESPEVLTDEITIGEDGNWAWTPPSDLSPGEHILSVVLEDGTKLVRSFVVLAAGEDNTPAFTATPSGEITGTPTPSPTTSPTPSVTPSVTLTPTPTSTSTPTPTAAARESMPATEEGVPEPGFLTPTALFVVLGSVLILSGLFFNFKLGF